MRKVLAPFLALAGQALARAIAGDAALAGPSSISREITFKASNGSDVVFHVGTGFGIVDDLRNAPTPIAKHIKLVGAGGYLELCTVRATKRAGSGTPRRDDCQALHDYIKGDNVFVYFEDHDVDLARWAEIFWVGTCAFRAQTFTKDVVFSNADVARFLDRALSREAWTIDGKMSASGEADCAAAEGRHGRAPMFWRLQERAAPQAKTIDSGATLEPRDPEPIQSLVVESLEMIPKNTSAYVLNDKIHNVTDTDPNLNGTLAKRFVIYTDGDMAGPFCDPMWLSSSWEEPNTPRKSDCNQLWEFVKRSKATVVFKERDLNYWAKFAAHGTCGISFMTTRDRLIITNRDMAGFLDRALRWDATNTADGGIRAKMGVKCGYGANTEKWDGEFRLFWRDPSLPVGQLERRDLDMFKPLSAESPEPVALSDDDATVNWTNYSAITADGKNDTFQINTNVLTRSSDKLTPRVEYVGTPLGPSKRCNSNTWWMGGAHPDSATVEDCKKLRDFIGAQRMFWQFSEAELRNGRKEPPVATPVAKYGSCHFAYGPRYFTVIGNMDIERLLDGAIEHLDNTHGRMRGWGFLGCDFEGQFGHKTDGYWNIYP